MSFRTATSCCSGSTFKGTMKRFSLLIAILLLTLMFCSCGSPKDLVEMTAESRGGLSVTIWEDRVYVPFCVISKRDCGELIGFRDGDEEDTVYAYLDYSPEEWLVSAWKYDGGAILLKEESVTDIPKGLVQEYFYDEE